MSDMQEIATSYERNGNEIVAVGDMGIRGLANFRELADEAVADETVTVVALDLTRVPFMDSSGLREILSLQRRAEMKDKTVALKLSSGIERLLQITGTTELFTIVEPEE